MPLFFCAGMFFIFVMRSKRTDMLNGVSWGQFAVFMLVAAGVYYLYVLVAYYRAEAFGWLGRKPIKKEIGQRATGSDSVRAQDSVGETEPKATGSQAELFEHRRQADSEEGQFQQMQRAIEVIGQVVGQGIENKLDRENVLDHIREILRENKQLRKTEFAETINNFLVRVCASELSLQLGERELTELWK
jgi:hypothetical protein